MNSDPSFWWNWPVNLGIAIGTISAVAVALFGDWLRAKIVPPRLRIRLLTAEGEIARVGLQDPKGGQVRYEAARYYHLRVWNAARWRPATNTQVFLTRVEQPGPDGEFRPAWIGDIPMRWRSYEVNPLQRTFGPEADCDLCNIVKGKWLELTPLLMPFNLQEFAHRREATHMRLTLQARATEGDSAPLRIEIAWDGEWCDGAQEMAHHMVVKEIP